MQHRVAAHTFDDCPGFYARVEPELRVGSMTPAAFAAEAHHAREEGGTAPLWGWPAKLRSAANLYGAERAARELDEIKTRKDGRMATWAMPEPVAPPGAVVHRTIIRHVN